MFADCCWILFSDRWGKDNPLLFPIDIGERNRSLFRQIGSRSPAIRYHNPNNPLRYRNGICRIHSEESFETYLFHQTLTIPEEYEYTHLRIAITAAGTFSAGKIDAYVNTYRGV